MSLISAVTGVAGVITGISSVLGIKSEAEKDIERKAKLDSAYTAWLAGDTAARFDGYTPEGYIQHRATTSNSEVERDYARAILQKMQTPPVIGRTPTALAVQNNWPLVLGVVAVVVVVVMVAARSRRG